jgi:copper chaperone CopZ
MKKLLFSALVVLMGMTAHAQFSKASLTASGLTCSMCSKAVKTALDGVPFIEKVQVNIKTQEYNLSFREGMFVDFDALSRAVEDAGFSVAALKVTATMDAVTPKKDQHIKIGSQYFHFLNGASKPLAGETSFNIVDKSFVSEKDYKKWSAATKMECVKTGKAAACCMKEDAAAADTRIYHVVI